MAQKALNRNLSVSQSMVKRELETNG
jgi:hypothetical protein